MKTICLCLFIAGIALVQAIAKTNTPKCAYQNCLVRQPLCAQNAAGEFQDFGDPCQLNNYNCDHPKDQYVLLFYGVCKKLECEYQNCLIAQPTCGINAAGEYMDFGDPCQLNNYNCDHPEEGWKLAFNGKCKTEAIGPVAVA